MKAFLREILLTILLAVAVFFILQSILQTFIVIGISMEPTFQQGQRLLINKVVYKLHQPERGDVIVFKSPQNGQADFIKRLIALPGDKVEIKQGAVYINGTKLGESYINENPSYTLPPTTLKDDEYFVLGDNRNHSNDSHSGWTVPEQNIIGKAWLSIWPPNKWRAIAHHPLSEQLASPAETSYYIGEALWR